jgi:hypothetical protein
MQTQRMHQSFFKYPLNDKERGKQVANANAGLARTSFNHRNLVVAIPVTVA